MGKKMSDFSHLDLIIIFLVEVLVQSSIKYIIFKNLLTMIMSNNRIAIW